MKLVIPPGTIKPRAHVEYVEQQRAARLGEVDFIQGEDGKMQGSRPSSDKADKEKAEEKTDEKKGPDLEPRVWTAEMIADRDTAYTRLSDLQKAGIEARLTGYYKPVKGPDGKTLLDENGKEVMELQGPYEIGVAEFQRCEDALQAGLANEASRAVMETWYADVNETSDHYAGLLRDAGVEITDDQMTGLIVAMSARQKWSEPETGEPRNLEMAVGFARVWDAHPEFKDMTDREVARSMKEQGLTSYPAFSGWPEGTGGTSMYSHNVNAARVMGARNEETGARSDGSYEGTREALSGPKYLAFQEQIELDGNGKTSVNDVHMLNIVMGEEVDGHLMDQPKGPNNDLFKAHGIEGKAAKDAARAEWDYDGTTYMAISDPIETVAAEHNLPVGVAQAIMWGSDLKKPENAGGVYRGF